MKTAESVLRASTPPIDVPFVAPATDSTILRSLVHHAQAVPCDMPLEMVHRAFADRAVEFLALVRNGAVTGVCSRLRLGILLGARYGFALYSRSPAHLAQVERPLVVSVTTPVREVLNRALARPGDSFHEDVALVDEHHALVGLVPIDALARLQTRLVSEQVLELQRQHEQLVAMERQIRRQEKQALLDTLVGGIAHELNNKLTPVQGFSELIALTSDVTTRQYAELITKCVGEAAYIIRQLLQLSKPSAASAQCVDLRTVVAEALTMLRFQIRDARCDVETELARVPVWVKGDPAEFKQVVMNLALNALQATTEASSGRVVITVGTKEGSARLAVRDDGIGIPPENLERVFDPFFTTKGPEKGSGLGLSVCASIVRQHGGEIVVESEPGAGATFTVRLPLQAAPAPAMAAPPMNALVLQAPDFRHSETRVLVIEDETQVRRLMQTVLSTRFGCEVDTATTGIEAFERLANHRYTLVISDIRMPEMDGTEVYLWLREAQPETAERFVFVSGYPREGRFGADFVPADVPLLAKPFTVAQLCELCARFLDTVSTPSAVEPVPA